MNQEAQEYYNIASWTKDKVNYNRVSKFNTNKHRQVLPRRRAQAPRSS